MMRIAGLVALYGEHGSKERTVLIPDGSAMGHDALLIVEERYVHNAHDNGELVFPPGRPGQRFYHFNLRDKELLPAQSPEWDFVQNAELHIPETRHSKNCPHPESVNPPPPDAVFEDDLHWLPRVSEVLKQPGARVKPRYLDPNPAEFVIARMPVTGGWLSSAIGTLPDILRWDFGPEGRPDIHRQAVAEYLNYTFSASAGSRPGQPAIVRLPYRRFGSTEVETLVDLKPGMAGGTIIVATVANVIPAIYHSNYVPREGDHDHHFLIMYEFLETRPAGDMPAPQARGYCSPGGGSGSGVNCGPDRLP